jgi:hypothetical protein
MPQPSFPSSFTPTSNLVTPSENALAPVPVSFFAPSHGGVYALPSVFGAHSWMAIANDGPCDALLNFGSTSNLPARPDMPMETASTPGLLRVKAGTTVVVGAPDPATEAAGGYGPVTPLILGGPTSSAIGQAAYVAVAPSGGGSQLTFERGVVKTRADFAIPCGGG